MGLLSTWPRSFLLEFIGIRRRTEWTTGLGQTYISRNLLRNLPWWKGLRNFQKFTVTFLDTRNLLRNFQKFTVDTSHTSPQDWYPVLIFGWYLRLQKLTGTCTEFWLVSRTQNSDWYLVQRHAFRLVSHTSPCVRTASGPIWVMTAWRLTLIRSAGSLARWRKISGNPPSSWKKYRRNL